MSTPVIYYRRNQSTPLSCEQIDDNWDAVRDRSLHTGTQLSSTISNLRATVLGYDFIIALQTCCTTLTQELQDLQESLFGEGELSNLLNTLRNDLLQDLAELQTELNTVKGRVTTTESSIATFNTSLASLSNAITSLNNSKANINSPQFTGTPTAPTPLSNAGGGQIATVDYVNQYGVPIGVVIPYAGQSAPNDNWLLATGQAISRATYAGLFALFGTFYGGGDGSTTFNLPNLATRVPVGAGNGYSLGTTGGATTHTLIEGEMPNHGHSGGIGNHTHTVNDPSHNHTFYAFTGGGQDNSDDFGHANTGIAGERDGNKGYINSNGGGTQIISNSTTGITINSASSSITLNNTGGGQPHNNMQPYIVLNYIVKVK